MERFIAIDTGKFATKCAEYDPKTNSVKKFKLRSNVSAGDFRDDALEDDTFIVDIGDGHEYKVGNGARGQGAELETDKMTDTHKICVLTALAMVASSGETDKINVAIGLPALDWANVSKREDYREYMLPKGEIEIKIKKGALDAPVTKKFVIGSRYVFPESVGALFSDEMISTIGTNTITGVIDLGNLNLNATMWQGKDLLLDMSATAELGGAILIQELSQELSAITPCNTLITANILKSEDRALPKMPSVTDEQIKESRELIKRVLKQHAMKVRRICNTKNWSIKITNIVAIGGTSDDLKKELTEAFDGSVTFVKSGVYCNVLGYLRMMCAREKSIGIIIPISKQGTEKKESKETDNREKKAS